MDSKRCVLVTADNVELISYEYSKNFGNNLLVIRKYVGNAKEIFEKNGIPEEYQKVIMETNSVGMLYQRMNPTIDCYPTKFHRFKASEFITGLGVYLAYRKDGKIFGESENSPVTFSFKNADVCTNVEAISFLSCLKNDDLLGNYIKSIAEIAQFRTTYSEEFYDLKVRAMKKIMEDKIK